LEPLEFRDEIYLVKTKWRYRILKFRNPNFSRFLTDPPCDGQTDGRAMADSVARYTICCRA